ncbi:hypothetical protein N855_gp71 [Mycobacterium phage Muddy]|uniref:Uncharacterized protein n=2 Tax=Mycobacterium phage Muddy TaxID=1340829 RepID=A0ACD4QAD4_9CAUD|nr:hypothetical protein N855_gp71 [Mycobacterium phage Muddy]WEV84115.1 hypothetical protein PBI_MUDDY_71 [Mycobacterium phage Muddy]
MEEAERVVDQMRRCPHDMVHYLDGVGNRKCGDCNAFVRPVPGAALVPRWMDPSFAEKFAGRGTPPPGGAPHPEPSST